MKKLTFPSSAYYFPPGESIARRIHEERVVGVLYGSRALLLGALDPLAYTATMAETRSFDRPFRRLSRTAKIQETVLLGTREEADKALKAVHSLHRRVEGSLETPAGGHPAGTRYSAFDQELMLWTLAVIADSARAVYEAMIHPLSASELELLWQDYLLFGELFGMSRDAMPAGYGEFSAWLEERIGSPEFRPTPHGRAMAPIFAFDVPVQVAGRPMRYINNLVVKGTVPESIRHIFGIRWTLAHQVAFRMISAINRFVSRFLPGWFRRGRNDGVFDNVVRVEARRGGTRVPDLGGGGLPEPD